MDSGHYSGLRYPTTDGDCPDPLQHHVTDRLDFDATSYADYPPIFPAQYTTAYNPIGISPILDGWHQLLAV